MHLHPTDRYPAEYLHCDTCTIVSANFKLFSLTIASLFHAAGEPYLLHIYVDPYVWGYNCKILMTHLLFFMLVACITFPTALYGNSYVFIFFIKIHFSCWIVTKYLLEIFCVMKNDTREFWFLFFKDHYSITFRHDFTFLLMPKTSLWSLNVY